MNKERHQHQVKYHYCDRCGSKVNLLTMEWQDGLLLCKENGCIDTVTLGERDANIARILEQPTKELQPDEKLTQPTTGGQIDEIII